RSSTCHNNVRRERNQFGRKAASAAKIAPSPASVDPDVAALRPPGLQQPLPECGGKGLSFLVALDMHHQQPDPPHALSQLRPRREGPRCRRAANERDKRAAPHSITSSASASSFGGISRPSALAVLRLMTKSNLVGCTTGKSLGLAPLRI